MNNFLAQKFYCSPSSALALIISPLPVSEIFIFPSTVNLESLKTLRVPPSGLKPSTDTTSYTEVCVCVCLLVAQYCLQPCGLWLTWFLCPWNSLGNNTGVDCHSVLQGTFSTQRSNPGLLHCRQIHYHLNLQGSLYPNQGF